MIKKNLNIYIIIVLLTMLFGILTLVLSNTTKHIDYTPQIPKNIEKEKKYGEVVNIWDVNYITIREAEYLPIVQRTRFNLYGVDGVNGNDKLATKYMVDTILGKNVYYSIVLDPVTKNPTNYIWVYLLDKPESPPLNILLLQEGWAITKNKKLKHYEEEAKIVKKEGWNN